MHFEEPPQKVNILTLNCWGLKFLAKYRRERLSEIGRQISIAQPVPEIVGLQECWTQEDYRSIREQTRSILPYGKFYFSGIFGGGLAILSKWPIVESNMLRYPLNGRPTAFFRGDWFVGKGVAYARIRMGASSEDVAEVFCTHLHAPYEREPNDSYICHRTAQAWEIAKLMRGAAERGHLVIGLGDFNMIPLSLAHRLITTHAPVKDVWRVVHPDSSIGAAIDGPEKARRKPIPTIDFSISRNGTTCDSLLNTWRWSKEQQKKLRGGSDMMIVESQTKDPKAKRLDYIFIGSEVRHGNDKRTLSQWTVEQVKLGMTQRHPTLKCSLSDHFSVEATIVRNQVANGPSNGNSPEEKDRDSGERFDVTIGDDTLDSIPRLTASESLPVSTYDEILTMTHIYTLRERRQRRLRLSHFVSSVFVSIGCFIAIWWSPHNYVSFILLLVSTLGLGAGMIDGLIGGLFVGSEIRALKEFEWEIKNARRAAGGGASAEIEMGDWYD